MRCIPMQTWKKMARPTGVSTKTFKRTSISAESGLARRIIDASSVKKICSWQT